MSKLTSIIIEYDNKTQFEANLLFNCVSNINKYTEPEDYELILVERGGIPFNDPYKVLKVDVITKDKPNPKGTYLVFMHKDVFVFENWLEDLRNYLEMELCEAIVPDELPRDRDFVLRTYTMNEVEGFENTTRGDGLLMVRKSAYNLGKYALKETSKVQITHCHYGI